MGSIRFSRGGLPLLSLLPKCSGDFQRFYVALQPPLSLFTRGVDVVVVDGAEGDGELIAHLQAEAARLGVADVVGVSG